MSKNISEDIDKKIASIVRKELKNENYDDECWLKAFKKADGDEQKAKAFYIDFRTNDLKKQTEKEKIADDLKTNSHVQCGRSFCVNRYQILLIPKKSIGVQLCEGCGNTLDQKVNEKSALRDIAQKETQKDVVHNKVYETSRPKGKYFFDGKEGLAKTFWGYFIGGNAVLTLLAFGMKNDTVIHLIIIIQLIWYILAILGVFKAADIYKAEKIKEGQSYEYATAAKIACVILALSSIGSSLPK